jgi:hypothetical protein
MTLGVGALFPTSVQIFWLGCSTAHRPLFLKLSGTVGFPS